MLDDSFFNYFGSDEIGKWMSVANEPDEYQSHIKM